MTMVAVALEPAAAATEYARTEGSKADNFLFKMKAS